MFTQLSKRPWLIAVAITVLLLVWLFSGGVFKAQETASADAASLFTCGPTLTTLHVWSKR